MGKLTDELKRTREIAIRLNLGGSPETRWLRAVVVELITAIVGDDVHHDDLELSGATAAAPEIVTPIAARAPTAPAAAPGAPMRPTPAPAQALTIEEAARQAAARAKKGVSSTIASSATRPNLQQPLASITPLREKAPDPAVPDPGGEEFAERLAADLAREDAEHESTTTDTTTTEQGA